jgi:hypothetical protein
MYYIFFLKDNYINNKIAKIPYLKPLPLPWTISPSEFTGEAIANAEMAFGESIERHEAGQ